MDEDTISPWRILDEALYAPCKVFDVYKRRCQHPVSLKEGDFYVIKSPDWALVLALTPDQKLITVKQYRVSKDCLFIEIPGGIIDGTESPIAAAARELSEETGYSGDAPKLIGTCHPNPAILNNTAHFVLIENCKIKQDTHWDEHEELQVQSYTLDEIDRMVEKGQISHAITLNGLLFLKNYLAKNG